MQTALPDVAPLEALNESDWNRLGDALRAAGVGGDSLDQFRAIGNSLFETLRRPVRHWHLRRAEGQLPLLFRLLTFEDSLSEEEYRRALEADLGDRLLEAGFVQRGEDGQLACPYFLTVINEVLVLSDHVRAGGDAVMGVSSTTAALVTVGTPHRPVGRVLEIGCGAGAPGLYAARRAEHVVATDISPRSLTFAQANAWMNRISNIEFRLGDMYEPVDGATFDWIIAQPPFLPQPPGSTERLYLYGGERGDEILRRMIQGAAEHLNDEGLATFLADWPEVDDVPAVKHVEELIGRTDVSLLVLQAPPASIDDTCALYASHADPHLGPPFTEATIAWREQFEAAGIRSIRPSIYVLRRSESKRAWAAHFDAQYAWGLATAADVASMFAARDLCAKEPKQLLEACIRFAPSVTVVRERAMGPEGEESVFLRSYHPTRTVQAQLGPEVLAVLEHITTNLSVRTGLDAFAAAAAVDLAELEEHALPWLQHGLLSGMLRLEAGEDNT